tara:strand:- start:353 stop:2584 length:2232 start_codon:yes stop_codon:yes gene_type:complete
MSNYTPNTLSGLLAPVNAELEKVQQAIADKVDRDPSVGQPNELKANLDANSKRIINLGTPSSPNDAVRLKDLQAVTGESAIPLQEGNTGKFLSTNGTTASWNTVDANSLGLGSVNNTTDLAKPVSNAQQTALNLKGNIEGTTTDLISSGVVFSADTVVIVSGYATSGDSGGGRWKQNGVTGQTVSQSPAQLVNGLLNDALGNQWALVLEGPVDVKSTGALGDGFTIDDLAIKAADATGPIIFKSGTFKVSSNFTIANVVKILPEARLSIDTGVTINFTEQPICHPFKQVFEGLGTVSNLHVSYCEWFMGDLVDTTTVSALGIQKALTAVKNSGNVILPYGFFTNDSTLFECSKGQKLIGYGDFLTEMRWNSTVCNGFNFTTNIAPSIEKMSFVNQNLFDIPSSGTALIFSSAKWRMKEVTIRSGYRGLDISAVGKMKTFDILDCIFIGMFVHDCNDVYGADFIISAVNSYLTISGVTGTFVAGETLTGGTSTALGTLNVIASSTLLKVAERTINFVAAETITGSTSGATATISSIIRPHQQGGVRLLNKVEAFVLERGDVIGGTFAMTTDATNYSPFQRPAYNKFTDVYFDSADQGVFLNRNVATRFTNCWFSNRPNNGLVITGENEDISFVNCDFINNWNNGALISNGSTKIRFADCTASGNNVSGGGFDGLQFGGNASDFSVIGGTYGGTLGFGAQRFGVHVNGGASNRYIITNVLATGNATAGVQDGGTGTNKVVANNIV